MTQTLPTSGTRTLHVRGQPARKLRNYRLRVRAPEGPASEHVVTTPSIRVGSRKGNELVLADETVSRFHFEITADSDGYRLRDLESTNGTFVDGYRARDIFLKPGSIVQAGSTQLTFEPMDDESDVPATSGAGFGPLVGESVAMRELFATLQRAAPTNVTVLVEGETGTGKELVAQALHQHSDRAGGPFVVFDCAAVPRNLVESELFGHEKGAFTGATERRVGRLEEAHGGTLFLDEMGELTKDLQPKLLRVLESRQIRRVGGKETRPVDVRVVAATNRDLAREVNRGNFREDLYYRLAVVRVTLPPLRERRDDIPLLVDHFIRDALRSDPERAQAVLGSIRKENWARLKSHSWPGNIRELRNVIERTLALSAGTPASSFDPPTSRVAPDTTGRPPQGDLDLERPFVELKQQIISSFEESYLSAQLERHDGNISRAAAASGLDRMYFKRLLRKYR